MIKSELKYIFGSQGFTYVLQFLVLKRSSYPFIYYRWSHFSNDYKRIQSVTKSFEIYFLLPTVLKVSKKI